MHPVIPPTTPAKAKFINAVPNSVQLEMLVKVKVTATPRNPATKPRTPRSKTASAKLYLFNLLAIGVL